MGIIPHWEQAFLQALAETGVAAAAARTAGIGVRAASKRRQKNPTFAAAWDAAADLHRADAARRAMSAAKELVIGRHGGGKVVQAGQTRWSSRSKDAFLNELAATASVRRAAAAAGFSPQALYARRRKDAHFAEAWDMAVAVGRTRIEAYLVESADRTFDPDSMAFDAELPRMSIAEAIKVLQLAQGKSGRPPKSETPGRGWIGPESWDDPDDEQAVALARENIINRLQRMREIDKEEKLEAGWTRVEVPGSDEHTPEVRRWTWVPPGFAPVVDARALPDGEEQRGPRVVGF